MIIRMITALIGIPLILFIAFLGGIYWMLAITVLALLSFKELAGIFNRVDIKLPILLNFLYIVLLMLLIYFYFEAGIAFAIIIILMVNAFLTVFKHESFSIKEMTAGFFGICYVGILFGYLVLLRNIPYGLELLILVFALTWSDDTGAYFIGKFFGRHKLAPKISPQKTWEGSLGGALLAVAAALFAHNWLQWAGFWQFFLLGILAAFWGQVGDLVESAVKRWGNVKDSGTLLPGHGGILDRFDSMLFVAPLVYYFANFIILR